MKKVMLCMFLFSDGLSAISLGTALPDYGAGKRVLRQYREVTGPEWT